MIKALLVYPENPVTFWSFKYALKFIHRKAAFPPLGLLTVASMLPSNWDLKLIDLNIEPLTDKLLVWADYVLISAMNVQRESTMSVIDRCKQHSKKIIGGGPFFTAEFAELTDVDYLILNEAEITLPLFLNDLENGTPAHIYRTTEFADLNSTPAPKWSLINMKKYATMNIQYSRGCPYDCDFCDITLLFGHKVRTKSRDQVIWELEALHSAGWRDEIFFVDDNFIGNKSKLKNEILPSITWWQSHIKRPHSLNTQVSIDISDDPDLMRLMTVAGFDKVFVGIESPHAGSLNECNKFKNENRDLLSNVITLQRAGLEVAGGFIVGFDNDPSTIFDTQVRFIQRSGIVTAMVGLLNALPDTKLYHRLHRENRIVNRSTGDNMDFSMNFIPKMRRDDLIKGYQKLLLNLYSPKVYYARVRTFLKEYRQIKRRRKPMSFYYFLAFVKSIIYIGFWNRAGLEYWKLFFWTIFNRPSLFKNSITFSIFGFHFSKILKKNLIRLENLQV
jgi:radical SAM superfamily enzyme YgiQ (UPF0313 family)